MYESCVHIFGFVTFSADSDHLYSDPTEKFQSRKLFNNASGNRIWELWSHLYQTHSIKQENILLIFKMNCVLIL